MGKMALPHSEAVEDALRAQKAEQADWGLAPIPGLPSTPCAPRAQVSLVLSLAVLWALHECAGGLGCRPRKERACPLVVRLGNVACDPSGSLDWSCWFLELRDRALVSRVL